jgi:hypothetical protein
VADQSIQIKRLARRNRTHSTNKEAESIRGVFAERHDTNGEKVVERVVCPGLPSIHECICLCQ